MVISAGGRPSVFLGHSSVLRDMYPVTCWGTDMAEETRSFPVRCVHERVTESRHLSLLKGLDIVVEPLLQMNGSSVNPRVVPNYMGVPQEYSSAQCMPCGCTLLLPGLFLSMPRDCVAIVHRFSSAPTPRG